MRRTAVVCGLLGLLLSSSSAADPPARFADVVREGTRATLKSVAAYIEQHPDADDVEAAAQWLFAAALDHSLEADAVGLAAWYQQRGNASPATKTLAQQVEILGHARAGRGDEAISSFAALLRSARLQTGGALIEFGKRLATELCLERDFAAARAVYEQISSRFFLNQDVRAMCDSRLARLDLVGQPAPAITAPDTRGGSVDLAALAGKVVLVDFWATNCPPCLEELPNLKQLHAAHRDAGFEIVGVSLDDDAGLVNDFAERAGVTWPMIVADDDVQRLRQAYHVPLIPAIIVIDTQGRVHQVDVRGAGLRRTIEELLAKK